MKPTDKLTATDPCVMESVENKGVAALTVGKEYEIIDIYSGYVTVINDYGSDHEFEIDGYFPFEIKK